MSNSLHSFHAQDINDQDILKEGQHSNEDTKLEESATTFKKRYGITSRRGAKSGQGKRPFTQASRSLYKEIQEKMKALQLPLWNASATTWVRDSSPQHKIPQAPRFTSLQQDKKRNTQFLKLKIQTSMSDHEHGRAFAKSTRNDHFINKSKITDPSPANYRTHRFLSNSSYKSKKNLTISPQIKPKSVDKTQKTQQKTEISCCYLGNPQGFEGVRFHYQNSNHYIDEQQCRFDELKGRTFSKAENYHKMYLPHGKQFAYNEHFSQQIPGVGKYSVTMPVGKNKASFSMRKVLFRFNERIKATPGASDYINNSKMLKPSTQKPTFPSSKRIDLAKPLNTTPGPAFYSITRYLENKKQEF